MLSDQYTLALSLIYIIICWVALQLSSGVASKLNEYASLQQELAAQFVNSSDLDASKHSAGHLNKKKKLSASSLKLVSEEATVHTSISAADMLILDSSSNLMGDGAHLSKKVKVWPAI